MTMDEDIRKDDIAYDFLENDRIWPLFIVSNHQHPFIQALVEVLMRLPDKVYDVVSRKVSFVVEDDQDLAVNVSFSRSYPPTSKKLTVSFDTIVIFHQPLTWPHTALVGLLAHELAHSIVYIESDHKAN
ncbi:hypothetical protein ACFL6U_09110 [Planctomycetota bacterium]